MKNKGRFILITVTIIAVMVCLLIGMSGCGLFKTEPPKIIISFSNEKVDLNKVAVLQISSSSWLVTDKMECQFVGENICNAKFKLDSNQKAYLTAELPGIVTIKIVYSDNGEKVSESNTATVEFFVNYISSPKELAAIADSDATYYLANDIDLSSESNWTPIEKFSGVLKGNGFAIKNLSLDVKLTDNVGLFGELKGEASGLKIENVDISGFSSKSNVGAIAGKNSGTIRNCEVSGVIDCEYATKVGGIAGYSNPNLIDNINYAKVHSYEIVGGIAGYILLKGNSTLKSNTNNGEISGNKYVGGVAGSIESSMKDEYENHESTISDLSNFGRVTSTGDYVGGIAGNATGVKRVEFFDFFMHLRVAGCTNDGVVEGKDYVGSIYGNGGNYVTSVTGCANTADIFGENYVGGYVGFSANAEMINMNNNNKVTGKGYVGGIAGYVGNVKNCKNSGEIISKGTIAEDSKNKYCVGGIAGYCQGAVDCKNYVDISLDLSGEYVGGIAGYINCKNPIENNTNNGEISVSLTSSVGGIAGEVSIYCINNLTIKNNINEAPISGLSKIGGIVGRIACQKSSDIYDSYKTSISDCVNNGDIFASGDNAGGIAGYAQGIRVPHSIWDYYMHLEFTSNINNASVTAGSNAAAIVGKVGSYVNSANSDFWSTNKDTGNVSTLYN